MKAGTAQVDITPGVGSELCGFAARTQPSTGVLDSLFARCLYCVENDDRLLWVNLDLVGIERSFAVQFRQWACERFGLQPHQVMLSAIHTHSGPPTIRIQQAGHFDPAYVTLLQSHLEAATETAVARTTECEILAVESPLDLAVDRRKQASAHTDPLVTAIGWRKLDGTFEAVLVNYAMHAVALGATNRQVSADWPGRTAAALESQLPGDPVALVTNGACGNLNPPAEDVPVAQVNDWGAQVAGSVLQKLSAAPVLSDAGLGVVSRVVPLRMDVLDDDGIEAVVARAFEDADGIAEWGDKFRSAISSWRQARLEELRCGRANRPRNIELLAVQIGPMAFVGVNAEVFSWFTQLVRQRTGRRVCTVGYANGLIGYLPTSNAYDEGGYEVEQAHLFYNSLRVRQGGLEALAEEAAELVEELFG